MPYGIPETALQSYAYAASVLDRSAPDCHIGWPTLAAIGAVMSDHGSADGSTLAADATVSPNLRGLRRARVELPTVADTDGGRIDGDRTQDVPMGPMQLMPSVWEQWSTRHSRGVPASGR
ncbi:murein transglycosylase, partial [Nocardia sp. NPDC058497]